MSQVLLYEAQPLLVEALREVLERAADATEINLASDRESLDVQLQANAAFRLVFLGLQNNDEATIDLVRRTRRASPAKLILFCDLDKPEIVRRYFHQGVEGIIPRSAAREIVFAATKLVLAGGTYLPPEIFAPKQGQKTKLHCLSAGVGYRLTPQQGRVLSLVAQGLSNKQIAHELAIAEGTVKLHVNAILKALNVSNRTAAALVAHESLEFS